jgi:ABC-2 type transport system ATP-binding protein
MATSPKGPRLLPSHPPPAIQARGLGKRYGDRWVLRDVDIDVPAGSVLGLLGPNGAGKTTTVRILTTLLRPDAGGAHVAGFDVVAEAARVRPRIGLAGQSATIDGLLTGQANLELVGRLYKLAPRAARARAAELLERFDLGAAAGRLARTYSGGMRRRLDLAASLVAAPPVLFLDEPTTGLDPRSRNDLWDVLRELVDGGTTLLLTTQYLEEADRLADRVAVIDAGRVIASGTPAELKAQVGGERVVVTLRDAAQLAPTVRALAALAEEPPHEDAEALEVIAPVAPGTGLFAVVRALDAADVEPADVALRSPTLDDAFLTLTGHDTTDLEVAA